MSPRQVIALAALATIIPLAACSTSGGKVALNQDLFPEERIAVDPSDELLIAAINQHLININGPKNSQYEYVRQDLNGDGLREGIVLFNLPHSYWCGWSGCSMVIFEAGDNDYALVSETKRIRGPIIIGSGETNGWADINVRLSGTDSADKTVALRYDGFRYPESPIDQDEIPYHIAFASGGVRVFP
jgi:hypothetical protein